MVRGAAYPRLPRGSKDLLPPAAARRRALVAEILEAFASWGYRQVVTPTVEHFEVLSAGLSESDRRSVVRFIDAQSAEVVALRSDVTPQIARMVAQHRGTTWPANAVLRLSYTADVVRQPSDARAQTEYHQVGVELIGDGSPAADAELVALSYAALRRVGLSGFRFDLSHGAVARGMLDTLDLSEEDRGSVEALLARKDRFGLEAQLQAVGVDQVAARAVGSLCDAYGGPQTLAQARETFGAPSSRAGLDNLAAIASHLALVHPDASDVLDVDLGEVRGFDYYTGARLRVWAPGVAAPILRGGRYDDLAARYGSPAASTGFAFDLDALEQALGRTPQDTDAPCGTLVAMDPACPQGARVEAARRAAAARGAGEPAWVQADLSLEHAQTVAADAGAAALTFLAPQGDGLTVHKFRRESAGGPWTRE